MHLVSYIFIDYHNGRIKGLSGDGPFIRYDQETKRLLPRKAEGRVLSIYLRTLELPSEGRGAEDGGV
jgi:hypothetical protein